MRVREQDDQSISFSVVSMDSASSLILFQRLPVIRADGALELWLTPYQVLDALYAHEIAVAAQLALILTPLYKYSMAS